MRLPRIAWGPALLGAIFQATISDAHDLTGGGGAWNSARGDFLPLDRPRARDGLPPSLEHVVGLSTRWVAGQQIRVCFYGGGAAQRKRILDAASEWFKYANLKLVRAGESGRSCVSGDTSEVRIGFKEPGYWSYVGNEGMDDRLVTKDLSTMNLADFDTNPPSNPKFTGVVLHEFGHALGFHHEHQSPAGRCEDEYKWEAMNAYFKAKYNWEPKEVKENMRQLDADSRAYDWSTALDIESVMIYGTKPEYLVGGEQSRCYFHERSVLSKMDREGARRTYGPTVANELTSQAELLERALSASTSAEAKRTLSRQLGIAREEMSRHR